VKEVYSRSEREGVMDGESGELRRCGRSMNRQVRDRLL